jgi:excisionase family DNA binding protein
MKLMRLDDVASALSVHRSTVERWIASGELPSYKFGEAHTSPRRVDEDDLKSFVAKRHHGGSDA